MEFLREMDFSKIYIFLSPEIHNGTSMNPYNSQGFFFKTSSTDRSQKGLIWFQEWREVLRFEDAEIIKDPNVPNEWEQRTRDKPLLDIP